MEERVSNGASDNDETNGKCRREDPTSTAHDIKTNKLERRSRAKPGRKRHRARARMRKAQGLP